MTLIENRPLVADPCSAPAAARDGSSWVLEVSRQLRGYDSVEAVMARVGELAIAVTGCRQALLIGVKPSEAAKPTAEPERQIAQACVAAGATIAAGAGTYSPEWQAMLGELAYVVSDPLDETDIVLSLFVPNGAGRHAAALVLHFDAAREPASDLLAVCQGLAAVVDAAVAHRHAEDQVASLLAALQTSREIGTAIGILMATKHVGSDEAFAILRELSQRSHRKINAIAAEVVYTGMLPA